MNPYQILLAYCYHVSFTYSFIILKNLKIGKQPYTDQVPWSLEELIKIVRQNNLALRSSNQFQKRGMIVPLFS